jgi:hypothetical protein
LPFLLTRLDASSLPFLKVFQLLYFLFAEIYLLLLLLLLIQLLFIGIAFHSCSPFLLSIECSSPLSCSPLLTFVALLLLDERLPTPWSILSHWRPCVPFCFSRLLLPKHLTGLFSTYYQCYSLQEKENKEKVLKEWLASSRYCHSILPPKPFDSLQEEEGDDMKKKVFLESSMSSCLE